MILQVNYHQELKIQTICWTLLTTLALPLSSTLGSFVIIPMSPNIDNDLGLSAVRTYLDLYSKKIPPANCLLDALELCLRYNNSIFNNESYLQIDGATRGGMFYSRVDVAVAYFDKEALKHHLSPTTCKRSRINIFVL